MKNFSIGKIVVSAVLAIVALVLITFSGRIFETNEDGYFQIKQAFWVGTMSVRSEAGTYQQNFGKIWTYKNVATVGFGKEVGDGSANIPAIPVIFNDGSKATISGLVRVTLPRTDSERLQLKNEYSRGYEHFIESGILPIVRNAVKLSANLRSAQDAYTTLALFQQAVQDQLENGTYVTKSDKIIITSSTGDQEEKQVTVIALDENGNPQRIPNKLQLLGCEIKGECVIDVPDFDAKVEESISKRKDEAMKTELAKQEAIRAKQDAIKAEEQGKANAAKAKWKQEEINAKEIAEAEKIFKVSELAAKTALEDKKKVIAQGQAEAEANRLKVQAGLTPQERAEWDYKTKVGVAAELAKVKVPNIVMNGGSGGNGSAMDAIGINMLMGITEKLSK